jgi:hypothetical protein
MNRVVQWDVVKDVGKNAALYLFETWFGRFNQPDLAETLRQWSIMVMSQAAMISLVFQSTQICEPRQFAERDT